MSAVSSLFRRICSGPQRCVEEAQRDQCSESCSSDHEARDNPTSEDSSDSSGSSSSSSEDSDVQLKLKRRKQTLPAREAAKKAKLMRKIGKQLALKPPMTKVETYLPDLQPNCDLNKPGKSHQQDRKRRQRLIFSWLKAACSVVNNLFQPVASDKPGIGHVFSISIIDDTNVVLSKTVQHQWQSNRIVTVLNNFQTCTVCYDSSEDSSERALRNKSFVMHTPPICLPKATALAILAELRGWLVLFTGMVGLKWQIFGLKPDLFENIPVIAQMFCFDSLKTNLKIMKVFRQEAAHRQQQTMGNNAATVQTCVLMGMLCGIHQLSLCRRSLLFFHKGFWSSLVRLAHLFEAHNFRAQFRSALFAVIVGSFQYIAVPNLPEGSREWLQERRRLCNCVNDDSSRVTGRSLNHVLLSKHDNGDCHSESIVHWCCGQDCCRGNSSEERSDYSLMMICKYFCFLFGFGFAVPLSYRWKHCQPALRFCQDTWSLLAISMALVSTVHRSSTSNWTYTGTTINYTKRITSPASHCSNK